MVETAFKESSNTVEELSFSGRFAIFKGVLMYEFVTNKRSKRIKYFWAIIVINKYFLEYRKIFNNRLKRIIIGYCKE